MSPLLRTSILLVLLGQLTSWETLGNDQAKRFLELYKKEAAEYEIHLGDDTKLTTSAKPVYHFVRANPATDQGPCHNGTLFVWTHNGRAKVIGSIWGRGAMTADGKRTIVHEFVTLAAKPIRAERRGRPLWHPPESGLEAKLVPGARPPAASVPLRLTQMRAVARDFSMIEPKSSRTLDLRMLPQPIYRYKPESANALDGAVFAFVWDYAPEAFLIIEERETGDGRRWHYAVAPFGSGPFVVRHKDTEVWTRGRWRSFSRPESQHFSLFVATYTDYFLSEESE